MEITKKHELKTYYANECCIFRKTKEAYGGLSNMASGFPLNVNGITILSSEALYQACRFPHLPDVQKKIIDQKSPMSAKMVGKPFRSDSRPDWDDVRIKIMRWCLRVKIAQNFTSFGKILESTYNKQIVEDSNKDNFWGAIKLHDNENVLVGVNALGRLLMELRQFYNEKRFSNEMFVIEPLNIPDFKLYDRSIKTIDERDNFITLISKSIKYYDMKKEKAFSLNGVYADRDFPVSLVNEPDPFNYTVKNKKKATVNRKGKIEQQATLPL